jgi:hypothetical protein
MNWLLAALSTPHVWIVSPSIYSRYIRSLFRRQLFTDLQRWLNCVVNFCWVFLRNALLSFVVVRRWYYLSDPFIVDYNTQTRKVTWLDIRLWVEMWQAVKLLVHIAWSLLLIERSTSWLRILSVDRFCGEDRSCTNILFDLGWSICVPASALTLSELSLHVNWLVCLEQITLRSRTVRNTWVSYVIWSHF